MVRGPALLLSLVVATGCGRTAIYGDFGLDDGVGEAGDPDDDDEPPAPVDCDKVDFLFVIDNSGSMYDHQVNLIENFEVITAGVDRVIEGNTDLHVGVVSTDIYAGNPVECQMIGGLVNHPSGAHSSDRACGPWAAGRYMTNADDVDDGFACAAQLGTTGSIFERPMDAMLAAIEDDGPASECNAGFVRDDALLVTVVVTDEWDGPGDPEDGGSWTGPDLWTRGLVDAKGSDESYAVVMLVNEERGQCRPGHVEHDGHVLAEWAESQPFGFVGSICGDYGESFSHAVDVVAAACAGE